MRFVEDVRSHGVLFAVAACVAMVACAFAVMGLAGCSSSQGASGSQATQASGEQQGEGAVTFTDSRGKQVTVDHPQRVVACMGSFAHIWELAGGSLVGASNDAQQDYSISSDVQNVGDFSSLDQEAIIGLDPDLVIMTSGTGGRGGSSSQTEMAQALEDQGITVACFKVTTFDDYLSMLRTCCDITGRDDLYQANGQDVADRVQAVKDKVPADQHPSVLAAITYSGGTRVQGSSTAVGSIVSELGGQNIADKDSGLLKDYSMESVIDDDPDCILIVPMGNSDDAARKHLEESTAQNPAWANLTAVKDGRYQALDPSLFLKKPCENWDQAYQVVYDALYA